jgi:hypothetical protein
MIQEHRGKDAGSYLTNYLFAKMTSVGVPSGVDVGMPSWDASSMYLLDNPYTSTML